MRAWILMATGVLAIAPGAAEAAERPNLKVTAVTPLTATAVPGASVRVKVATRNTGRREARRSATVLLLSRDSRRSRDDLRLVTRRVTNLRPRRARRATVTMVAPGAGVYRLIACADFERKVKESRERDNCRTARAALTVSAPVLPPRVDAPTPAATPAPGGDRDGDGTPDATDCAPADAAVHPGATDKPDEGARDSDCDGIDGTAEKAVFVSPIGDDTAPGTRAAPKRTLAAAAASAYEAGKDVYATFGTYEETLTVFDGVSVYGGYDSDWSRDVAAPTKITGSSTLPWISAFASTVRSPTVLQKLTLAPRPGPPGSGYSIYGFAAVQSPGLRLEHLTVVGATGGSGAAGERHPQPPKAARGGDGQDGHNDYNGSGDGGPGGQSAHGRPGGRGGWGAEGDNGEDGQPGGIAGSGGGPPGPGGGAGDPGKPGGKGGTGDGGTNGANGAGGIGGSDTSLWISAPGKSGGSGTPGHGGGGGGAGGGETCTTCNDGVGNGGGGGGAGGAPGLGGGGGGGGGGSFGLYLLESTGIAIVDCVISAADGGKGGTGGDRGLGGQGGDGGLGATAFSPGDIGAGGNGGAGGHGGFGGYGGGGAGGPSWAIYRRLTEVEPQNTTLAFGSPGAGGFSPGGNSGAAGAAGAIN